MKYCYLLGYPVEHSISPDIQNAAFHAKGLEVEYRLAKISPEKLATFVDELRDKSVLGFNVTIPHKVEVLKHLDEVEENARAIGAVNTVKNSGGHLIGFNTDGVGGVKALEETYGPLEDARVLILGAGGAARALTYSLIRKVKGICILNRNPPKAYELASELKQKIDEDIIGEGLDSLEKRISDADILINTTPVGMKPDNENSPITPSLLRDNLFVYDIVYNPIKTKLLRDAEKAGAKTLSGVKMLVYQGAEAFKIWTGVEPPMELMLKKALDALGG